MHADRTPAISPSQPFYPHTYLLARSRWTSPKLAFGLLFFVVSRPLQLMMTVGTFVEGWSITPVWLSNIMALIVSIVTIIQLWSVWVHYHLFKRIKRQQRESRLRALTGADGLNRDGEYSSSLTKKVESARNPAKSSAMDDSGADGEVVVEVVGSTSCEEVVGNKRLTKDDKARERAAEVVISAPS